MTGVDAVLVPIQCEYYALEGLTQLIATINLVRDHLNPDLAISGVVLTMFDGRTNLSTEVADEVRRHLRDAVFDAVVPRSVRLSEAPSHGLPIALYRPDSKGAEAYARLAVELRGRRLADGAEPCRPRRRRARDRSRRMTDRTERNTSALGRGLSALIPQRAVPATAIVDVPLARVRPNPYQPRRHMDDAGLEELAASIREHGVLQPVLVTETLDGYQLIAGERRVRAARLAGLERIPALVRQLADQDQLEVALVENVQRADLDPIEEALAYRQFIDEFGLTQERVAERVGKARATVANTLRLLDLHADVQAAIGDGRCSEGHGRALAGLPVDGQAQVLRTVLAQGLSVRQTEELVRRLREPQAGATTATAPRLDPDLERVETQLRERLGTKVSLSRSRTGGRIVIEYYSDEELSRLYEHLIGGTA